MYLGRDNEGKEKKYIIWNIIFETTLARRNRSVNETHWAHSLENYGETKNLECTARRRGGSVEKYERQTGCVSSNPETRFSAAAGGQAGRRAGEQEAASRRGTHLGIVVDVCITKWDNVQQPTRRQRRWQRRVRAAVAAYPDPGRDRCLPNWLELRLSESYWIGHWVPIMDMTRGGWCKRGTLLHFCQPLCSVNDIYRRRLMRLAKAKVLFIVY